MSSEATNRRVDRIHPAPPHAPCRAGGRYLVLDGPPRLSADLVLGSACCCCAWFWSKARKATAGVPSKGQALVELVVEFVDGQVKDIFHGNRKLHRAARADDLPLGVRDERHGHAAGRPHRYGARVAGAGRRASYLRVVPTADLNTTFAMSITVFLLVIFYSDQAQGRWGLHEGAVHCAVPRARHGREDRARVPELRAAPGRGRCAAGVAVLRLFGNMYAGELDVHADRGMTSTWLDGCRLSPRHRPVLADAGWTVFHILVIACRPSSSWC